MCKAKFVKKADHRMCTCHAIVLIILQVLLAVISARILLIEWQTPVMLSALMDSDIGVFDPSPFRYHRQLKSADTHGSAGTDGNAGTEGVLALTGVGVLALREWECWH